MVHQIHIQTTLNNTIITLTDFEGNTKVSASAGFLGFKNSRKSTTYASQTTAEYIAKKCRELGILNVEVKLKGIGFGKESSLRGLQSSGLFIKKIEDITSLPHNGCRLQKKRRL
jgi:small subunit ribosomal protein S11